MSDFNWKTGECNQCGDKITNAHRLLHYASKHEICILCDFKNISEEGNFQHMSTVHEWKVNCDYCEFQTFWADMLNLHTLKKHRVCTECKATFESIRMLVKHQNEAHKNELRLRLEQCEICVFASYPTNLKVHMKIHKRNNERIIQCPNCDAIFEHKVKLSLHLKDAKKSLSKERFPCDECEFKFCNKSERQLHLRKDHPDG